MQRRAGTGFLMTGPGALEPRRVLLFYDGHERRAEQELMPRLMSDIRRNVRVVANRLRGKQIRSGYYTWFHMLIEALERVGCEVRVNDFRAARHAPEYPIGLVGYPSVLDKTRDLARIMHQGWRA